MIDKDEYPQTAELELRCVNMLADLWNAPDARDTVGTSTTGSSEACMLGGMALLRVARAPARGRAAHRPPEHRHGRQRAGVLAQVRPYWDVEQRLVPMEGERYMLGPEEAVAQCDENTIGVVGILGSTFTGEYEPIAQIAAALDDLQERTGLDVPIHVDARQRRVRGPLHPARPAVGLPRGAGQVDQRLGAQVRPGAARRGLDHLARHAPSCPRSWCSRSTTSAARCPTFAINFSRPGSQIVAQYYNFIRLGREGYRKVQQASQDVALFLADRIEEMGPFQIIARGSDLPIVSWQLKDGANFTLFEFSDAVRSHGWQLPAYTLPANRTDLSICRIVVRHGFSRDLAGLLLRDMGQVLDRFAAEPDRRPSTIKVESFSHS